MTADGQLRRYNADTVASALEVSYLTRRCTVMRTCIRPRASILNFLHQKTAKCSYTIPSLHTVMYILFCVHMLSHIDSQAHTRLQGLATPLLCS